MSKYTIFTGVSVVILVVILPLVSFYYLRQGLSFRINSLTALELNEEKDKLSEKVREAIELPKGRVNVLINSDVLDEGTVDQLVDKFGGNAYFTLHVLEKDNPNSSEHLKHQTNIHTLSTQSLNALKPYDMILVDTSGQVRNAYIHDDKSFKKFVQHLSVLLPVEQSRKIILER